MIMILCKRILFSLSLIYVLCYLPLAITIYIPTWYKVNVIETSSSAMEEKISTAINNLTQYFRHANTLNQQIWSTNERLHMMEVRDIYDILFLIALASSIIIIFCYSKKNLAFISSRNFILTLLIIILLITIIILTSWNSYWSYMHTVVFPDNTYYKYKTTDISHYLFPGFFFQHSIILIIAGLISSLSATNLWLKYKKKYCCK